MPKMRSKPGILPAVIGGIVLLALFGALIVPAQPVKALPEYAGQVGEPCAPCHVSAAGGGPRGPRGMAWVALGRPATVPDLQESLDTLGVKLTTEPGFYTVVVSEPPQATLSATSTGRSPSVLDWLLDYTGN